MKVFKLIVLTIAFAVSFQVSIFSVQAMSNEVEVLEKEADDANAIEFNEIEVESSGVHRAEDEVDQEPEPADNLDQSINPVEEEPVTVEEKTDGSKAENQTTESQTDSAPEDPIDATEKEINVQDPKTEEPESEEQVEQEAEEIMTFSTFSVKQATMPFKQGDYHDDLISIKEKLNAIGFGGISETDYFGSWTKTRVKQFQEYYGLSATGEIDQVTLNKINEVYNSPFQLGKRHESTKELKEKLNSLGYGHISVTTLYGSWTVNRVEKFQRENGLRVNGIADERTWAKINELINELLSQTEFKVGDRHPNIVSIKQKLNAVGFDGISETDYYGGWTKTRVLQFQEYYGLAKTGTTNEATLDKLNEVYTSPFQLGERHESTRDLKEKLNSLGYGHISVTTLYGSWTKNRVEKFQRENGLRVNGIADERTWAKLNELLAQSEFKVGDRHPNIVSLKQKLNAVGFDGISETDYYGSWTATRVKQFQAYYGLSVTGTTNDATMTKLDEVYYSPFQLGERHESTKELKRKLNRIGFGYITVTDFYGSFTEKQVEKFQRHYGLKVNGIADRVTQKKINEIYNHPLQKGKSSAKVIDLKRDLNALGYDGISLTNYFGSWTETRLKQFQSDNNLPVSGIADEITLKRIKENSYVRIFIDPGHGGHDSGATSYGLQEKDVVLDIGLSLARELSSYKGVEVILSRANDTYESLAARTNAANNLGVNYFVSLHANAHNGSANGFESFIFNGPVSQETIDRQQDIHSHLAGWLKANSGINDRGAKRANFHVLRESEMPSILLEYMFIDNQRENNLLRSISYRNTLGKVTAEAIAKSFNLKK